MRAAPPRLVVSVHDVSPASERESRRWVHDLDERGVPASLLVIPGPWRDRDLVADPEFASWLRACVARGHEVCLHGWDHQAPLGAPPGRALVGNLVARGCAEFWSLSEDQAAYRARRGLEVLTKLGLQTYGFTPPGWLISAPATRGLHRAGLRYVTTHRSVTDLHTGDRVHAAVICHRPQSRGERAGAVLMARAPKLLLRPGRTLRVALHPDDLLRPGLREAALRGIDAALAAGAHTVTYGSLLEDHRSGAIPGDCLTPRDRDPVRPGTGGLRKAGHL
jgi:predicted deacetylase